MSNGGGPRESPGMTAAKELERKALEEMGG